jgi:hypothetical protein
MKRDGDEFLGGFDGMDQPSAVVRMETWGDTHGRCLTPRSGPRVYQQWQDGAWKCVDLQGPADDRRGAYICPGGRIEERN